METVALKQVSGGVGKGPIRVANSKFCFGYFQEAFGLRLAIFLGAVGLFRC